MVQNPQKITISVTTCRIDMFFRRTLHSVRRQTAIPDEVVIVVDGFSWKMNGEKALMDLPPEWKLVWTESEDSGPAMVRNLGMHHSSGDWIVVLDGDDFLAPSFVESYRKILTDMTADVIVEFQSNALIHQGMLISKNMPPDKVGWSEVLRLGTKTMLSGMYKRGDMPIRPVLIRNENKKYYPIDYCVLEDKMLLLQYMQEERKIVLSDYCGYIRNIHPLTYTARISSSDWHMVNRDEIRFKKVAANTTLPVWTLRDKIFEPWRSHLYLTDDDQTYINETIKYFSGL